MNLSGKFLGVAALALAFGVPSFTSTVYAQNEAAGVAQSGAKIDLSVLDVPEGKDAAFYQERLQKIGETMNAYAASKPAPADLLKAEEKLPAAYLVITKNLAFAEGVNAQEAKFYFSIYCSLLAQKGDVDSLLKLGAQVKDDAERFGTVEQMTLMAKIRKAGETNDVKALQAAVDETIAKAQTNDVVARGVEDILEFLSQVDGALASKTMTQICENFKAAKDELRNAIAKGLEGKVRRYQLFDNEMVLEGLFLDGKEIDWKSYRGKIVLVDFWATWCGPCRGEIPNMREMYKKYHDAGFEIISYSVDSDLEALKKFEETEKLPWATASEKMSVDQKDENGKPKYRAISDYYGVDAIPCMILIGKDGKAIDLEARGAHLNELLGKLFPEVK